MTEGVGLRHFSFTLQQMTSKAAKMFSSFKLWAQVGGPVTLIEVKEVKEIKRNQSRERVTVYTCVSHIWHFGVKLQFCEVETNKETTHDTLLNF